MKVLIASRHLNAMSGGVEKNVCWLANELHTSGHQVATLSWDDGEGRPFFPLPLDVRGFQLDLGDPRLKVNFVTRWKRILKLRRLMKEFSPDLIICFQVGTLLPIWLAALGLRARLICTERNSLQYLDILNIKRRWLLPYHYLLAESVVVQFDAYRRFFPKKANVRVIPNPVFASESHDELQLREKIILAVGRHSFQKDFEILIRAAALIAPAMAEQGWRIVIIGDGELKTSTVSLAGRLKVGQLVEFKEAIADLVPWYRRATVLCMPSRWEGFPNVMAEAFSHGLPAVGFSDCDGVNLLIQNGESGWLVAERSPAAVAECLGKIIADPHQFLKMGVSAKNLVRPYDPKKVTAMWRELIEVRG